MPLGKMSQYISRVSETKATKPLELVYSDLSGPITLVAKDGFRYSISLADNFSLMIYVLFLTKQK